MPHVLDSWAVTAGLLLIPAALAARYWIRPRPYPGIPHYPVTSWLGDIPKLATDMRKYGTMFEVKDQTALVPAAVDKLGPVFQLLVGPMTKMVFVADSQEIDDVLLRLGSKHLDLSDAGVAMFSSLMPEGQVALKTNDMWRRHRRMTTPLMSSTYLSQMTPLISASARRLVALWENKAIAVNQNGGVCFSCQDDFHKVALDVISVVVTGESLGLLPNALEQLRTVAPNIDAQGGATFNIEPIPLVEAFHYLLGVTGVRSIFPPPMTRFIRKIWTMWPRFTRAYSTFDGYLQRCATESRTRINESRAMGEDTLAFRSLMDMIIAKEGIPGDQFTESELRDEVLTFMLGGHDTIAHTMMFGVKYLTDAPEVQRTLRAELLSALEDAPDGRPLTYAEIMSDRLPYLEAVVAEILRCAKIAVATRRTVTSPITIFGREIPVGADIIFLTMSSDDMQSEENVSQIRARDELRSGPSLKHGTGGKAPWKHPNAFDPSRWLTTDEATGATKFNPKAGYSTPFGLGLRSCAGKQLAQLELKMYVATLNLAFFFDVVPEAFASHRARLELTRVPEMAYVAPRAWGSNAPQ